MHRLWVQLLPGAAPIVNGNVFGGLLVGLFFAIVANFAVVSWLIVPAEFSWEIRVATTILALLAFLLPSRFPLPWHKARTASRSRLNLSEIERRVALAELVRAIDDGGTAEEAFRKLQALGESDLHVAFRLARYAEFTGDDRASELQHRLRAIDRHRIYTSATGKSGMSSRSL